MTSRILCVHPGASWSTADVWTGLLGALGDQGHEVVRYNLGGRIQSAESWLNYQWRRKGKPTERPNGTDMHYLASFELPYRALRYAVDWILVIAGTQLHPDALALSRRAGIPIGVILTESPYEDERQIPLARLAHLVWTNERGSVSGLRERLGHERVHYLPHAYDPKRHYPGQGAGEKVPAHDVVFVGTGFQERIDLLADVNWEGIDLGLYGTWELLGSRHKLRRYLRGGVTPNGRTADLYRRARIGLNLYRTSMEYGRAAAHDQRGESLNPRALELAACGLFHLSDYRPEVAEVFGKLVPTFRTAAELEELIRAYLGRSLERRRVARLLPETVAGRDFGVMARQVVGDMERALESSDATAP